MRLLVVIVFLGILFALGSAFFSLTRGEGGSGKKTVKALTWRISLSIGLLLFLYVSYRLGWIEPHGLMPNRY